MDEKQKPKKQKSTMKISEHEKIVKILHEELLRKDKIIDELKLENQILIKTALKRSEALDDMQKKLFSTLDKLPPNRKT